MLRFLLRQGEDPGTVYTIDPETISGDAHASIIAGWALNDGRTIEVRLPQAGAEIEFAPLPFFGNELKPQAPVPAATRLMRVWNPPEPDLTVITRDGRKLRARYVGLDGQTGLSVLQVNAFVMPPLTEEVAQDLTEGQPLQLFTPDNTTPLAAQPSPHLYVH